MAIVLICIKTLNNQKNAMKKLKEAPKLKTPNYSGVKVSSMLKALKVSSINKSMLLSQRNDISIIDNTFKENKHITPKQMAFIWNLYWHFVLNDFRYEDK